MTMKSLVDYPRSCDSAKLSGKKVATFTITTYKREPPKLGRPLRGLEMDNE